jgi:uroporphyrinogen decarboxylase
MDNVVYVLRPPIYAETGEGLDGRRFVGDGRIKTEADLTLIDLPDPRDDGLYAEAAAFARQKGDRAAWFVTRAGFFPTLSSMGLETFSIALYENRPLIERVFDRYADWAAALAERAGGLGFDVFATTDDMGFKTGPFFSPAIFRELVVPRYRRIADRLAIRWVVHTDGNVAPFIDDLLSLGIAGLHPIENGAMDIRAVKRRYGSRLCLLGNVDLDLLGRGTPEQVDEEVRTLIRDVAPGGGYIASSGNSLACYLRPENILAMTEAVQRYGPYPLQL